MVGNYKKENSIAYFILFSNLSRKRFDKTVETGLYRIAQEGLNNAVKHSQAMEISLKNIIQMNDKFEMVITDNGKGFVNLLCPK